MKNYQKEIDQKKISNQLYNLSSQISSLSAGDVKKAEFLGGKDLLPTPDPISLYLEAKKNERAVATTDKKLEEVKKEISGLRPAIVNFPHPQPITVDTDMTIGEIPIEYPWLTDDKKEVLEDYGLTPDILFMQSDYNKYYKDEKSKTISVNISVGKDERFSKQEKQKMKKLVRKYRDALDARQDYMVGQGIGEPVCKKVLNQAVERAKVLIGEINAGNTSKELRHELDRILLTLYKNDVISKEEYRNFFSRE